MNFVIAYSSPQVWEAERKSSSGHVLMKQLSPAALPKLQVNKPRLLFYIAAPQPPQQPCVGCAVSHFTAPLPTLLSTHARLPSAPAAAFTPGAPEASGCPRPSATPRGRRLKWLRRHKWLRRQTRLWKVSTSELPVLTGPGGAGEAPA